jgi:proteasome beta subunit
VHARNWIKAGWTEGMSLEDVIDLAIRSLFAAADEDVATGGPDLVRGIFPLVAAIDAAGFRALDESDVEQRSRALLEGRERGGGDAQ